MLVASNGLDCLLPERALASDVIAGLSTAAVVIPRAMAYATIAGLPMRVGLHAAFLPMVIYAALGDFVLGRIDDAEHFWKTSTDSHC
jgi:hypothetical protein